MARFFVYGTLMRGAANHAVLERLDARFLGEAVTHEPRTLIDLGPYPALLSSSSSSYSSSSSSCSSSSSSVVAGELWEIAEDRIAELDAFEGAPDLYARELITLVMTNHRIEDVFVYVLASDAPTHAKIITPRTGATHARYGAVGSPLPDGAKPEQIGRSTRRS